MKVEDVEGEDLLLQLRNLYNSSTEERKKVINSEVENLLQEVKGEKVSDNISEIFVRMKLLLPLIILLFIFVIYYLFFSPNVVIISHSPSFASQLLAGRPSKDFSKYVVENSNLLESQIYLFYYKYFTFFRRFVIVHTSYMDRNPFFEGSDFPFYQLTHMLNEQIDVVLLDFTCDSPLLTTLDSRLCFQGEKYDIKNSLYLPNFVTNSDVIDEILHFESVPFNYIALFVWICILIPSILFLYSVLSKWCFAMVSYSQK